MTLADRLRVSLALSRLQRARLTAEQRADLKTLEEALEDIIKEIKP